MERRKPAAIDRATALRYMGASGWTPDAATAALLDKAEQTVLTAAAPRAVYCRLPRTALPLENCGSDLTRHLQGCDEVLLLAATLGAEVDKLLRRMELTDIALAAAADALASVLLEQVCDELENEIRAQIEAQGIFMTGRYAPGYGDCPLELNDALCLAADTVRGCGRDAPAPFDPPQEYHRHFRHCRPSRDRHPRRLCDLPFKGDLLVPQARHDLFHTRLIGEKRMQIREVFDRKRFVFLDGGMGTQLQARGLQPGQKPELAALEMPEVLTAIHTDYANAGADILLANTFGANAKKLTGCGHTVEEVVSASIACARKAAETTGACVALDIGPLGELLVPAGTLAFEDAYNEFAQVIRAGAAAGADLVFLETMTDLYELKAAILAARENCDLPVFTSMSFESRGRTFTGCTVESYAVTAAGLGADAVGINCSLGPKEILPFAQRLCRSVPAGVPVFVKPNAGLPNPDGSYNLDPDEFAAEMKEYAAIGVSMVGGCCGTTPAFIARLHETFSPLTPADKIPIRRSCLCTPVRFVEVDGITVVGERINPTGKKRLQQALRDGDSAYPCTQAVAQAEAGAQVLDVNAGLPGIDEAATLEQLVKDLQAVTDLPLQLDSSNPEALSRALRIYNGKPIVNSVNGEPETLEKILPLCKKYGAAVVGLALDKGGIPPTAEGRFAIAQRIVAAANAAGIPNEDIYIDCLTLTASAQQEGAVQTLEALSRCKRELGVRTVLGVSNISFGLPERMHITSNFLIQALHCGLDLPIVNPNQAAIMDAIASFKVLSGEDKDSAAYIARFANAVPAAAAPAAATQVDLETAVARGLKAECAQLTRQLLETTEPLDIINQKLIPALDTVGKRYEKGEIFLPQLINSANASSEAFEVIKEHILAQGGQQVSKGKIILATVQGDIHDIGKNIVKVILENYGYQVIDLGRDVPPEKVVETAVTQDVSLIGLSALMTTTVPSMAATIDALKHSGHPCKTLVGGAVLTPEYATEIGADYYAKDAKQSADIAKEVLG